VKIQYTHQRLGYTRTLVNRKHKIKMEQNFYIPKLQNEDTANIMFYSNLKAFTVFRM